MIEEWVPVKDFPGYEVSNLGRVKTLKARPKFEREGGVLIMKQFLGTNGYLSLRFFREGNHFNYSTHRLVADHFHASEKKEGLVVAHLDNNKLNNCATNLRWCTQKENVSHTNLAGRANRAKGEKHPRSRLTANDVREIRSLWARGGIGQKEIAEKFKVRRGYVSEIVKGRTWKHI